jgi:4-methylaminobutanoate oxidase (formaldehyde-forming)
VSIRLLDPEPLLIHNEIVLRNGRPMGNVRSASYGHTLGSAVGLAMVGGDPVDAAYLKHGQWEVDIAGRIYAAEVSLRPFYDPDMERVKA